MSNIREILTDSSIHPVVQEGDVTELDVKSNVLMLQIGKTSVKGPYHYKFGRSDFETEDLAPAQFTPDEETFRANDYGVNGADWTIEGEIGTTDSEQTMPAVLHLSNLGFSIKAIYDPEDEVVPQMHDYQA